MTTSLSRPTPTIAKLAFVRGMRKRALIVPLAGLLSALLLGACSKPAEKQEDIRPVRAIKLAAEQVEINSDFSGEIRPRVESRLGFRVGGKIIARKVDVGTVVRRGQILMQLDPQDLALAQAQAKAGLNAAESNRDLTRADLKRYQELREKNFVAAAVLEAKETAARATQASYEQALAAYKTQSNMAAYGALLSDIDGIVTGIDAEVGQVVAAGTPVVRVAQSGESEVVVGIPEDKVNEIRSISDIRVRLWANPNEVVKASLRELSPVADAVTRTYTAKLSLDHPSKDIKLGMTAYVRFSAKNPKPMIKLPMTALYQEKGNTSVWLVEGGSVKLVPVQLGGTSEQEVLIAGGIQAGQTVVTAGVNQLKAGQKVSILGGEPAADKVAAGAAK